MTIREEPSSALDLARSTGKTVLQVIEALHRVVHEEDQLLARETAAPHGDDERGTNRDHGDERGRDVGLIEWTDMDKPAA